jgi:hypothetical protein
LVRAWRFSFSSFFFNVAKSFFIFKTIE